MPPVLHTCVPAPEMCISIIEVYVERKWLFVWVGIHKQGGRWVRYIAEERDYLKKYFFLLIYIL